MNKALNLIKRLILFFVGMTIIQFGVALYLKTSEEKMEKCQDRIMGVLDYRKAVKRGEQRKAIQIVRNALKIGIDPKLISAFTEMTEEEVEIIQIAFNDYGERI